MCKVCGNRPSKEKELKNIENSVLCINSNNYNANSTKQPTTQEG